MRRAVHAEWTKLRTSPEAIGLVCGVALTARWIEVGQVVVAVLAVMSNGMAGLTFTAIPQRWKVLAAKALVLSGVVAVVGVAAGKQMSHLVLIALLSLGMATLVRHEAAAIGVVLGLLFLFPILALSVSDPDWQRRLRQIGPMTAGTSVQVMWAVGSLAMGAMVQERVNLER